MYYSANKCELRTYNYPVLCDTLPLNSRLTRRVKFDLYIVYTSNGGSVHDHYASLIGIMMGGRALTALLSPAHNCSTLFELWIDQHACECVNRRVIDTWVHN